MTTIEIPLRWLARTCLLLCLAAVLTGCGPNDEEGGDSKPDGESKPKPEENGGETAGTGTASTLQAAPVMGKLPSFQLLDETGAEFGSERLSGKLWVANFIFTTCQATCPEQTSWMRKLQERIRTQAVSSGIRLVSITVDPENDTPEVLAKYGADYQAKAGLWKFLTGERDAIWNLAKDGFKLPVQENPSDTQMPISHDSKFVVVDRSGQIRAYVDVLAEGGIDNLLKTISMVVAEHDPGEGPWDVEGESVTHLAQPPDILDLEWLDGRDQAQIDALKKADVYHNFGFTDRRDESGITFKNQIVDEQRWRLQVNHYDHGNGICAADVDGDGLVDLYFVNQAGRNELWRNLGGGHFEDITEKSGLAVPDRISISAAFADTDNDGDSDLFVTTVRGGNLFFVNDGQGKFSDETDAAGLSYSGHSSAPVFFDYNRDGKLDLFVSNVGRYTTDEAIPVREDRFTRLPQPEVKYYTGIKEAFGGHLKSELSERSLLYRNNGDNTFADVTDETGLIDESWSGDATPIDADNDGWLDLYVLNMQGTDEFYRNVEGKKFVRETVERFPHSPWGAMGVQVTDFNNDGRFDLFLTDMHSDMSEDVGPAREKLKSRMQWPGSFLATEDRGIYGNAFFTQMENGLFTEQSDKLGAENYWPWGLSAGDLNADGFEDAFLASSMCFPYRYGINTVLLNKSGLGYIDSEFAVGVEPRQTPMIVPWFELDCDGRDAESRLAAGRSGRVVIWSAVGSRSSVMLDLEGDGDLDIVTNEFNTEPQVLISNLAEKNPALAFLKIRLIGKQSNRDGLGAVVTVIAGETRQHQLHDGRSGYLSQSSLPLYFGLGKTPQIDAIEVRWPSDELQRIEGPIEGNKTLTITQE